MNSFQVVFGKIFMNNFHLYEGITSAFSKLLGNWSSVLGQCTHTVWYRLEIYIQNYIYSLTCFSDAQLQLQFTPGSMINIALFRKEVTTTFGRVFFS
jgi:hypothetical protein